MQKHITRRLRFGLQRGLHLFPEPHHEVAIVNNSGLFFTLASIRKHGIEAHPNVSLITPDFWLDKTHSDYDDLDWGQTPLGLPWFVRNEFNKIFKHQDRHAYIRWGQMKEVRRFVISELKGYGIPIYTGIPDISLDDDIYKIRATERTFSVPKYRSHFYNSFRVANVDHKIDELNDVNFRKPHTEIYNRSMQENSNCPISILGSNRSTLWVARHFPSIPIACIAFQHPKKALFSGEVLPKNLSFYPVSGNSRDFYIEPSNVLSGGIFIRSENQERYSDFSGEFYCAIGLKHKPEVTNSVEAFQKTLFPTGQENLDALGEWINPEEQPIGGLVEATSRWAYITNNLYWAYECYCYHESTSINVIANRFEQAGIILSDDFFDVLNAMILNQRTVPSLEGLIDLYQKSYQSVCPMVTQKKLDEIGTLLNHIENERVEFDQSEPSPPSNTP